MKENTIENIGEYAVDETVVKEMPTGVKYTSGVQVGWTAPAKWWNALWGAVTKRLGEIFTTVQSIHEEIKNACGGTLDPSTNTQLKSVFDGVIEDIDNVEESLSQSINDVETAYKAEDNKLIKLILSIMLGRYWSQSNITSDYFTAVYYANGVWVAGSDYSSNKGLYYSTDGKTWSQSNITSGYFTAVYYANGVWVAGSNNGLYYSTDGKTWTQSNITSGYFKAVYYANGVWVAGNNYNDKGLYYSTDGKTWTQSNITSGSFKAVYYANGVLVAGSSNGLYYSDIDTLIENGWLKF